MRACKALIVVVFFAVPLAAHPVPFSYLDVQLQPGSIEITLTAHIYDLAHDLQITPMERLLEPAFLAERQDAIHALLAPRFGIMTDGRAAHFEWSQPEILQERQSVRFHLRQSISGLPGVVSISAKMFPYDPQHQTFVNVYESDVLSSQMILDDNTVIGGQGGVLNGKHVRGGEVLWGTPVRPLRQFLLEQAHLARLVKKKS